ncbi:unnamed protein product [Phytophthora lilii]|uniref:Unnamed protein product n=1 Tax=Phytophthora lilii TaxID=2077276 RepID=A0A9W6U4L0_9STRA|nr:unnamed protein product [Phytophthora lilii]
MDIVQASFQASFNSRVERLGDVDLADLRVPCVAVLQLGLDVNSEQVHELGEVYLNGDGELVQWPSCVEADNGAVCCCLEFMKIVDSHVQAPPPPPAASEAPEVEAAAQPVAEGEAPNQEAPAPSAEETERKLRNEKMLEDEWKLLDTYRRGRVSMQDLRLFLASVQSTLTLDDTERFLETYGNTMYVVCLYCLGVGEMTS